MKEIRENLSWVVGSIATAIAMIIGWLISSGVVVNLLFLLLGASVTYFVQTKTQERAWKREYSVKIAEEVYGELFKDIKQVINNLERKYYRYLSFEQWREIQEDHRYFMVDEKFRTRIDKLSERIEKYNNSCNNLDNKILPKTLEQSAIEIFNEEPESKPSFEVKYEKKNKKFSTGSNIIRFLKSNFSLADIKDDAFEDEDKSEITNVLLSINFQKADRSSRFTSSDFVKLNEFWELCLKTMNEDETYKFVLEESNRLLEEAEKVKKELSQRIEKPWKI